MAPLTIVVGITGGIAAYKAVSVVRSLVLEGHDVHVVPTEHALRFVGAPTLEAISRNTVTSDLYEGVAEVRHVALGQRADLIVIAPATANSIAKLAAGLADDLLGNTVLASTAPLVIAPAMHTEMWEHAATQSNVAILRQRGAIVVGPMAGQLTGSDNGVGRMAEPEDIVAAALSAVHGAQIVQDLDGVRVIVSAGGTREPLDPVRFLGNRSSGKQGVAIANAARARGAVVTLVAANLEVAAPLGCDIRSLSTTAELRSTMIELAAEADVVIMAAAVADYRPASVSESKLKKDDSGDGMTLDLVRNPDILAELGAAARRTSLLVGFAAETEPDDARILEIGAAKLAAKGADLLVVNRVGWTEGFGGEENRVVVLGTGADDAPSYAGTKTSVADGILDTVVARLSTRIDAT